MSDHTINPPDDDSEVERHKFYTGISNLIHSNTQALSRIFSVLENLETNLAHQQKFQAKLMTIGSVLSVIWIGASGLVGWYGQRLVASADDVVARVTKLERAAEIKSIRDEAYAELPAKFEALRSKYNDLSEDVSTLRKTTK